jgi:hypothetical protein
MIFHALAETAVKTFLTANASSLNNQRYFLNATSRADKIHSSGFA